MTYRWDDYLLDLDNFRLERSGVPVSLEPKALTVLAYLVQRPNRLVTKQEIFDAVWPDVAVTDHALTRVIAQLRKALGDEAREARFIETVPTRGYRWIRPLEERPFVPTLAPADLPQPTSAALPPPSHARTHERYVIPQRAYIVATAALSALVVVLGMMVWQRDVGTVSSSADTVTARHRTKWPVQITTRAGLELQPAIAPAGDAIAYASDRTGALEIYVRALDDNAAEIALTSDGAQNVQPAWSPDGRFIAYHSHRHGGVWVVPARGGVPRQVARQGSHPAWSPDGERIAFQSDEPADVTPSGWGAQTGSTLWTVRTDGSELTPLTTEGVPMGGHAGPAWSHDGRYLAFTVFAGGVDNGAWVVSLSTGDVRQVARGPGFYELVFGADDRTIYAAGGEAFLLRIGFNPDTGTATDEREYIPIGGVPSIRGLSMARNGTMAFAALSLSSQIWQQQARPDGTPVGESRPVTSDTSRRNSLATMSPDGTKIAYMSTRGGAPSDVWVMDADGQNPMSLTSGDTSDGKPTWFPDSRRIAYFSDRDNTLGIWSVDVLTRRHERLFDRTRLVESESAPEVGRVAELHLAPSISKVAFTSLGPRGPRVLHVATLSPFSIRTLTDGSESVAYPAWSPDERWLAVEIKDGSSMQAAIVDVETGAIRRLTDERGQTWVRSWSPDSRKIAVAALREGVWNLRWIDIETGREGIITPPLPPNTYVRYPEWSPRGDVILYERGELRGNIWTLSLTP